MVVVVVVVVNLVGTGLYFFKIEIAYRFMYTVFKAHLNFFKTKDEYKI